MSLRLHAHLFVRARACACSPEPLCVHTRAHISIRSQVHTQAQARPRVHACRTWPAVEVHPTRCGCAHPLWGPLRSPHPPRTPPAIPLASLPP